jgi:hypothetical protein
MENEIMYAQLMKKIQEQKDEQFVKELLKDNKTQFTIGENVYMVRQLTQGEKEDFYVKKAQKLGELCGQKDMKFRKTIAKECKEKGFDLEKNTKDIIDLQVKIDDKYEKLALMTDKETIDKCELDIQLLQAHQNKLVQEQDIVYKCSIEDCLDTFMRMYLVYLASFKIVDNKQVKAFEKYEDFVNSQDFELVSRLATITSFLIHTL